MTLTAALSMEAMVERSQRCQSLLLMTTIQQQWQPLSTAVAVDSGSRNDDHRRRWSSLTQVAVGWSQWDGRQRHNLCCSHRPPLQSEEERRCVGRFTGRPSIVSACLAARQSMATSSGRGRATNNQHQWQQERATRGDRVSGCGNITINQKISFDGGIIESGGYAAAAKMTARGARAGALWWQQRGIMATTAARTGVERQQWRQQ